MSKKNYEVGKNKPPKQHQWKKGQSGNPSGSKGKKPALELPFAYWLAEGLKDEVPVNDKGKSTPMPLAQALSKRVLRMMLTATPLELRYLFGILQMLNVFPLEEGLIHQKKSLKADLERLMKEAEAIKKGKRPDEGLEPA
jgi:hypothetical protein